MKTQASGLKEIEIRGLAIYLTGKKTGGLIDPSELPNRCQAPGGAINLKAPHWNGWGNDDDNTRYQPNPGLKPEDMPRLKLKWAFAYPTTQALGQPTIIGNRLYVTTNSRKNAAGTQLYGPAGAAIWSAPTLDLKRGVLYAGTGNSYTDIPTGGPDAIRLPAIARQVSRRFV